MKVFLHKDKSVDMGTLKYLQLENAWQMRAFSEARCETNAKLLKNFF